MTEENKSVNEENKAVEVEANETVKIEKKDEERPSVCCGSCS